jgi:hypothetical protein
MGVRWRRLGAPRAWLFGCALALALLLVRATPAAAQSHEVDVAEAEQAYVDLDFDRAIRLGEAAAAHGGLSHAQLVRTYALLGRAHAVLDHDAEARDAFLELLTCSPDEKEDRNLPPRVTARMAEARGVLSGYPVRPGIEVLPVLVAGSGSGAGAGGTLRVIVRDPTHVVQRLVVGWRWREGATFATASPALGGELEVPLPAAPPSATRLDYYASALDERDDVVFEVGTAAAPKTAFAPIPVPVVVAPLTREPLREGTTGGKSIFVAPTFWAITAGVVACIGTGAYFALRKSREELTPPTGAELAPWLMCGPTRCQ